jgi:succinoglycan biosynthesis protein ExoM
MVKTTKIDVCIATFKRPLTLRNLLESLRSQDLTDITMRLIIVDNDKQQSARAVVDEFRRASGLKIIYDVEPRQNISLARNRALNHRQADYVAFVDDDETVCSTWLHELLNTMHSDQADIVFGPVTSVFPPDAPAWAHTQFKPAPYVTGQTMQNGATGNVLIKSSALNAEVQHFDPSFGLTGGEDTDFFYRMHLAGRRIVWCEEAMVFEPVAPERLTLRWMWRRGFRGGQTFRRIVVSKYPAYRKPLWFMVKCTQIVIVALALPLLRMTSYRIYVALSVRMAGALGQLSHYFSGKNYEEYRTPSDE